MSTFSGEDQNVKKIENFTIHIGLHKTGSTTMQKTIFPKIKDIDYLGRPYPKNKHFINAIGMSRTKNILVSSETYIGRLVDCYNHNVSYLSTQLDGIKRLSSVFPQAKILIGVRSHIPWIKSCYKHYLKYGGCLEFDNFFSHQENGLMLASEFLVAPKLLELKKYFKRRVFSYSMEGLITSPKTTIEGIANFVGGKYTNSMRLPIHNEGLDQAQTTTARIVNSIMPRSVLKRRPQIGYLLAKRLPLKNLKNNQLNSQTKHFALDFYAEDRQVVSDILSVGGEVYKNTKLDSFE